MNIKLLGNENGFNSSPRRSVYRLTKNTETQEYTFIVPLDIWYLERDREGEVKDAGKPRRTPSSWQEFELGTAGGTAIAKLLGEPPNLLMGEVTTPYIKCVSFPSFKIVTRDQREIESLSKRPVVPRSEVEKGLKVFIGNFHAEVINTGVGFALDYLDLAVSDIDTYQLRVFSNLGKSAIGEPVYTVQANGKKAVIGMLAGFQSSDDNFGESDAWVLPAESIT